MDLLPFSSAKRWQRPCEEGPRVRIPLAPAESPVQTSFSGTNPIDGRRRPRFIGQAMALQNKRRAWTRYDFETLAGLPTTVVPGGTSRVTTLPAPTMASSPMLTPGRTIAPPPIQTLLPIRTGTPLLGTHNQSSQ